MRLSYSKWLLAVCLMLGSLQANATGFDVRIGEDTAEIFYLYKSSSFGYGGSDIGWSYYFNNNDDIMVSASLLVSANGAGGKRALQFGVGVKAYVADLGLANVQGGGMGIGGLVRYVFPSSTPVALLFEGYSVPSITGFGDAEGFSEARFDIEAEVSPNARAYIGYRVMTFKDELANEFDLDDAMHLGIRISF
ncbi:MAG: YfaZ family protein [Gammaproteobacteria bacterium]|nr:YfaZ family protein [Gammaproteobacteria bacterium]